jgi:hypothetical protein
MDVTWLQSMCKLFREKRGSPQPESKEASNNDGESQPPSSTVQKHLQQTQSNGESSEVGEHTTSTAGKRRTSKPSKVGGIR